MQRAVVARRRRRPLRCRPAARRGGRGGGDGGGGPRRVWWAAAHPHRAVQSQTRGGTVGRGKRGRPAARRVMDPCAGTHSVHGGSGGGGRRRRWTAAPAVRRAAVGHPAVGARRALPRCARAPLCSGRARSASRHGGGGRSPPRADRDCDLNNRRDRDLAPAPTPARRCAGERTALTRQWRAFQTLKNRPRPKKGGIVSAAARPYVALPDAAGGRRPAGNGCWIMAAGSAPARRRQPHTRRGSGGWTRPCASRE